MKKIFLPLLAVFVLLTCTACGGSDPTTENGGTKTDVIASVLSDNSNKTDSASTSSETDTVGSEESSGASVSTSDTTETDKTNITSDKSTDRTDQTITSTDSTSTDKVTNTSSGTTDKPTTTTSSKPTTVTSTTTTSTNTFSGDETQDEETPEEYKPFKEITAEEYYGKTWLKKQPGADTLVAAYESIVTAASDMNEIVTFKKALTEEQLATVWSCYRNDYPQHFWLESGYSYAMSGKDVKSLTFIYTMSKEQKKTAEAKLNAAVEEFLQDLHGGMNQFKIEKALHDRLVFACTYTENTHAHDAYGALVEKKAVCDGYAKAFQLLCRKAGIQALIAEGTALNPTNNTPVGHAWNVVQINGDYYHLDSTWDDTGEPDREEAIHYAWFNVTTAQILEDHAIQISGCDLPLCTAKTENYFRKTGKYLDKLTVDGLRNQLKEKDGSFYAHIFIEDYTNTKDWIVQNIKAIVSGFVRGGYQYSLQTMGHGLYLVITPT